VLLQPWTHVDAIKAAKTILVMAWRY
jgi:hypothetical protein